MVEDTLLKALLTLSGFGAPFDCSHDSLIGHFDPLVEVSCIVDIRYVDGENVGYYFF